MLMDTSSGWQAQWNILKAIPIQWNILKAIGTKQGGHAHCLLKFIQDIATTRPDDLHFKIYIKHFTLLTYIYPQGTNK